MKQIVDKLNKIAKAIDGSVEIPTSDLIIDSLDAITKAYGGTPNDSHLIVDKLEAIAGVASGGGGGSGEMVTVTITVVNHDESPVTVYCAYSQLASGSFKSGIESTTPSVNEQKVIEINTFVYNDGRENTISFVTSGAAARKTAGTLDFNAVSGTFEYLIPIDLLVENKNITIELYTRLN